MQPRPPPDPSTDPIRPMLAAEAAMPVGSDWAFEFVWDGLRAVAYLRPGRTRLLTGAGRSITASYPDLAALGTLADRHGPLVLDGTIVALDAFERPSAPALRRRAASGSPSEELRAQVPVRFYVCDLLYAHGGSTLQLPYRRRRELLDELDLRGLPAVPSPYFLDTDGRLVLHVARRHGLAGVVAKRLDSRYLPGRRNRRAWVETLVRHTQWVVLGGWQPVDPVAPGGDRVGALLVGVPARDGLRYVTRVRPPAAARRALTERLAGLARPYSPFHDLPPGLSGDTRWLRPVLVGEISYRRWEADGRLRHAAWLGLRPDAHPASVSDPVVMARPAAAPAWAATPTAPGTEEATLREEVRRAQADRRALLAQISPHFLYNVLNTIHTTVRTDPDQARELIQTFADYTRYSFRAGTKSTTVGDELTNAERYLALEGARFGDRLRAVVEVPGELRDVPLPFLGLQPLVEHVVRYGIEGTPGGGTVRITGAREDRGCVLTVSENATASTAAVSGPSGTDPDALARLLADVRERLDAIPGPAATVRVDSAPDTGAGAGVTITLRLPAPPGRLGR